MGFKIFGKKDGKRTVSDNPENGDTKVTEAAKVIQEQSKKAQSLDSYGIQRQETHIVGFKVKLVAHPFLRKRLRKGR